MTTSSGNFRKLITSDALIGQSLKNGEFLILDKLGQGGMGAVYKAEHRRLGTIFAIKALILPGNGLPAEQVSVRRFIREAKLAARLTHENIARVFDLWDEQGGYFMAMEYVEGSDLNKIIENEAPLSARVALQIARQVASSLTRAEKMHIVHRDIKPSNIRIKHLDDGFPQVKVLDFGIAKHLLGIDSGDGKNQTTDTNAMVGTPLYMAPEQISPDYAEQCAEEAAKKNTPSGKRVAHGKRGRPDVLIDTRTDLYSLGLVLYEMLCGQFPFNRENGVTARLFRDADPLPPTLPEDVRQLTHKLLQRNPFERHQSAEAVVREIDRILAHGQGGSLDPSLGRGQRAGHDERRADKRGQTPPAPQRWRSRHSAVALLLGVALVSVPLCLSQESRPVQADASPSRSRLFQEQSSRVAGVHLSAESNPRATIGPEIFPIMPTPVAELPVPGDKMFIGPVLPPPKPEVKPSPRRKSLPQSSNVIEIKQVNTNVAGSNGKDELGISGVTHGKGFYQLTPQAQPTSAKDAETPSASLPPRSGKK